MKHEQHPNFVELIFAFIFIVVFARVSISADIQSGMDFETQILPILKNRCFSCHSAPKADASGTITKPKGGVQLDSVKGIEESLYGEVIISGEPEASLLYQRITLPEGETGIMPPSAAGAPLTKPEIDLIRKWIEHGADYREWTGNQSESKSLTTDIHPHQPTVMPPITALAFSQDGKSVVACSHVSTGVDQSVRFWDLTTGELTRSLNNHTLPAHDLALRPNDTGLPMVASVSDDRTVRLWQPTIGRMVKFARLKETPLNVAWFNDGSRIVAACADGVVRLVDPDSVEVTGEIHALNNWAYSLAVHPTDRSIIVGGPNAQVRRIVPE